MGDIFIHKEKVFIFNKDNLFVSSPIEGVKKRGANSKELYEGFFEINPRIFKTTAVLDESWVDRMVSIK